MKKKHWNSEKKQAIRQIYLPAPKKIIRPRIDVTAKDEVNQANLWSLPFNTVKVGRTNKTNISML